MLLEIPLPEGNKAQRLFEGYLLRNQFVYREKGGAYHINVESVNQAFWIGCNYTAAVNELLEGPLTTMG